MTRLVRRAGDDSGARLVVLDTDSTGTTARVVGVEAYLPGRPVEDYDAEDLSQLDLDGLEEVEPTRTLWALFSNEEQGYSTRISAWMDRQEAEDALTGLHENGEPWVYLVSKEV